MATCPRYGTPRGFLAKNFAGRDGCPGSYFKDYVCATCASQLRDEREDRESERRQVVERETKAKYEAEVERIRNLGVTNGNRIINGLESTLQPRGRPRNQLESTSSRT